MLLQIVAAVSLAIWMYLLLGRGAFWLEFRRTPPAPPPLASLPSIVAIVPARNEADVVVQAVSSLAAQGIRTVLVDDHSDDATAETARAAASPDLLTVIPAAPLPPGWTGKLWAVSEGIRFAAPGEPDYYLLTDADIIHAPGTVASLAARAREGRHQLVSYMATLQCRTFAEHALVPAFVFFFFLLYPPRWVREPRRRTAAAAGGCMLIERAMLEKIGGIEAIRSAIIDDCALARAVKQAGGSVWIGLNPGTCSIREYRTFAEISRMISRAAFAQLDHSALILVGTLAGIAITYIAPVFLSLSGNVNTAGMASLAWLLMSIAYVPALRYYQRNILLWAPLLPLVAAWYMGATLQSAVAYWTGKGGMWKGRAQDII